MTIHTAKQPVKVSTLLPPQARNELVAAGKDQLLINAAHRYARAMHPECFQMDDDSYSAKEPKVGDVFFGEKSMKPKVAQRHIQK